MQQKFFFKNTRQLTHSEKSQILALFKKVFGKSFSQEHFDRKYLYTPLGYSYHGLMKVDNQIVGTYNIIPYRYRFFGKEVLFGLSVDLMIANEHRGGPFNIKSMASLVVEAIRKDGISFVFGFPNELSYDYIKRILKWKDIGELDFYIIPRNIGAVMPRLSSINLISRALAAGLVHLPTFRSKGASTYNIEKVSDICFEKHRYNSKHCIIKVGKGGKCVYRIYIEENGIRVLYIIDVCPLTCEFFEEAVLEVYRRHSKSMDIMLYVGTLPFNTRRLLIVPELRRPRRVRMCGTLLAPGVVDDRVFQIENWNVNISNFDVR